MVPDANPESGELRTAAGAGSVAKTPLPGPRTAPRVEWRSPLRFRPCSRAYATIVLPLGDEAQDPEDAERQDPAMLAVLTEHTTPQPWWLGYLETGAYEIPFSDAPKVTLYAGWRDVLVEAGPDQAAAWRPEPYWKGALPDLMFPADRSWLVSTLWDDDWTCVGGSRALVDAFRHHPDLGSRTRQVAPSGEDATPPGHVAR